MIRGDKAVIVQARCTYRTSNDQQILRPRLGQCCKDGRNRPKYEWSVYTLNVAQQLM
jgi:hypothetical protein